MSRVGAQKTISNFSKGWVTEYSPLGFPANSLQEALNIELSMDGSLETRTPYRKKVYRKDSPEQLDNTGIEGVKHFKFPNKMGMITVYLSPSLIRMNLFHKYTEAATVLVPSEGHTFFNLHEFDIAFLDDGFIYFRNEVETSTGNRDSQVVRCVIGEDGSVETSSPITTEPVETVIRYPETGYLYDSAPGITGPTTGVRWVHWADGDIVEVLFVDGVPRGGTSFPVTVEINGESRQYYKGELEETFSDPGIRLIRKYSCYYTVTYRQPSVSGNSGKVSYRDFYGMPHCHSDVTVEMLEEVRYPFTSSFMNYNLYNAGWRWGEKVTYANTKRGDTTGESPGSLASASKIVAGVWPSLRDSPDENKISTANNVDALGKFSPHLMISDQPLVGRTRRGSHILSVTGEYVPQNINPFFRSYFVPYLSKSLSTILDGVRPAPLLLEQDFYSKAKSVSNAGGITSVSYINGRAWYGVESPFFNVAFSQIEERSVPGFMTSPSVGTLVDCFQVADPNAPELNQLVGTDGGTISLRNVGRVKKILEFRNYILLFSTEGVWALYGANTSESFSPTSYSIDKVSSNGIIDNQHVVAAEDAIYYVSGNGIFSIHAGEKNNLISYDISTPVIKQGVKDLLKSFSEHKICTVSYDPLNKRVFFNYGVIFNPSVLCMLSSGEGHTTDIKYIANGMTTLVFDENIGAFYKWRGSSRNFTSTYISFINPFSTVSYQEDKGGVEYTPTGNTSSPLGFFYSGHKGVVLAYETFEVREKDDPRGGKQFVPFLRGISEAFSISERAVGQVDGEELVDKYVFNTKFAIPFETFGDPSVNKVVATASFYQDSKNRKKSELIMKSGWDVGKDVETILHGNIRYPVQDPSTHIPRVLMNKVKLPGSGKYLSLSFTNLSDLESRGSSFLGYTLSLSMETRP